MTRNAALLRLTARLIARRDALRRTLAEEVGRLREPSEALESADPIDAAVATSRDEICSRLAEIESRELNEIEQTLERIAAGKYGRCESCGGRIPSARLNVLPCTTRCINCQRQDEQRSHPESRHSGRLEWPGLDRGTSFDNNDAMTSEREFSVRIECNA